MLSWPTMAERDELAGRSVGEFVLRERIGEGGFGAVYRSEQPLLGREAVVKVLHQRLRASDVVVQRFLREAQLASRLDHPYAAHVYAFGVEPDGLLWIAMEMVHGTTLDRWLRERGPLPLSVLVPFFEHIAEVVQTAHEADIVHRDLKPSNIMVIERAGRLLPKLLDLGIAKLVADEATPHETPLRRPRAVDAGPGAPDPQAVPVDTLTASHRHVARVPAAADLTQAGAPIGSPPYMSPEQWTGGAVGPSSDIYSLGILAYEALTGRRPFVATTADALADLHVAAPVPPLGEGFAPALDRLFAHALAKSAKDRPSTALELAAALRAASGLADPPTELPRPPEPDDRAPYQGLAAFTTGDAERFVGREREADAFVNRLALGALQIVVGPSGSGKSSFVHAGVVPALRPGWRAITMRPGSSPIAVLAAKLQAARISPIDLRPVLDAAPAVAAALLAHAAGDGVIVLVVDQLEELFTLCLDETERLRFAAVLGELSSTIEAPLRVIGTVRDDFLMRVEALPGLRHRLSTAVFLLGNPSHDDLVRTIVEPARRSGYELSDGELAQDMAAAVDGHPGALALLSFTASRLWELRDRRLRRLTRAAYDGMGGVAGALGQHAEATLASLGADDQRLVRGAFRHLVTAEGTRAQLSVAELGQVLASERATAVVDRLVAARLLVAADGEDGTRVEVAHESLLAAWPRAKQWILEDADSARMRDQVRAAARQWETSGRQRGLLWRDDALADLERWRRRSEVALTELEAAFADRSRLAARGARRTRRGLTAAAGSALAAAVVVLWWLYGEATQQRGRADASAAAARDSERRIAAQLAHQYEEQARGYLLEGQPGPALLYLAAALDRGARRGPAFDVMLDEAVRPYEGHVTTLRDHAGAIRWLAADLEGGRAITAGDDGTARVWDLRARRRGPTVAIGSPLSYAGFVRGTEQIVIGIRGGGVRLYKLDGSLIRQLEPAARDYDILPAVTEDGRTVAAVSAGTSELAVWDLVTMTRRTFPTALRFVRQLLFSPDGQRLLVLGDAVELRDTARGRLIARLDVHGDVAISATFSRDGRRIATASWDHTAAIWDGRTGALQQRLRGHTDYVDHVAFDPAASRVVTASRDRTARVWSVATGNVIAALTGDSGAVTSARFDGEGARIVTTSIDGITRIRDASTGLEIAMFAGHASKVIAADFITSSAVVTTGGDGTVRIFEIGERAPRVLRGLPGEAVFASFLGREHVVGLDNTGQAMIWTTTGQRAAELPAPQGGRSDAAAVASDPDGVAIGDDVGRIRFWRDHQVRVLEVPSAARRDGASAPDVDEGGSPIAALRFTDTGNLLAAAYGSGVARLWDVSRGTVVAELRHPAPAKILSIAGGAEPSELLTADSDGFATFWDVGSRRPRRRLDGGGGPMTIAELTSDRAHAITASANGTARVWRPDGTLLHTLRVSAAAIGAGGLSRDGRRFITSTLDETTARVWDLASGRPVTSLDGHRGVVTGVCLDATGALAATSSTDDHLRIWDATDGRLLVASRSHRGGVQNLACSGDDMSIATSGRDGSVVIHSFHRPVIERATLEAIARCLPIALGDTGLIKATPPPSCQ
jgi:WD40 repeat protein/serine/threonine protein kinase